MPRVLISVLAIAAALSVQFAVSAQQPNTMLRVRDFGSDQNLAAAVANMRARSTASPQDFQPLCGRVVSISCTGRSSQVTLQLASTLGRPNTRLIIPANRRAVFGPRIENLYDQRSVCVSAAVSKGDAVVVSDPSEVVVTGAAPAQFADDIARTCDPDVTLPTLIREVKPDYAADALRAKVSGIVIVQGVVDREGTVTDAVVVQSLDPRLDKSVREAFEQWRFRPATRGNERVPMAVSVAMAFTAR